MQLYFSYGMRLWPEVFKMLGTLGPRPPGITPLPHLCYHAEFGRFMPDATVRAYLRRFAGIIWPRTSAFQGHWRSRPDLLLVIHSNCGSSRTIFKIKGNFGRDSQIFPTRAVNAHLRGLPLEFCNGSEAWNTRVIDALPDGPKWVTTCAAV